MNQNHHDPSQFKAVRFEFKDATAHTVSVAGSFNEWHPTTKTMHPIGGGHWLKETALPPGAYEYCFVVDGKWIPDPAARDTVPNPYGGRNSILHVASSPEAAHREEAENSPMKPIMGVKKQKK